jgi:hypothetical protein
MTAIYSFMGILTKLKWQDKCNGYWCIYILLRKHAGIGVKTFKFEFHNYCHPNPSNFLDSWLQIATWFSSRLPLEGTRS